MRPARENSPNQRSKARAIVYLMRRQASPDVEKLTLRSFNAIGFAARRVPIAAARRSLQASCLFLVHGLGCLTLMRATLTFARRLPPPAARGLAIPRRLAPGPCLEFSSPFMEQRARGMPGAQCTRSLVCAWVVLVCTRVFTAEAPETSGIPHAMVLRLISRSPRGPGFLAPVIRRIAPTNLAPASGRQDHTPLPSA